MTGESDFRPSGALSDAVRFALQTLQRHSAPQIYKLVDDSGEAGVNYRREYAFALREIPPQIIRDAALRWLSEVDEIASPKRFAQFARELWIERQGPSRPIEDPYPAMMQRAVERQHDVERINTLNTRAKQVLSTYVAVAAVWQLLQAQADAAQWPRIRAGAVSDDEFDRAVAAVKAGNRAPEPTSILADYVEQRAWRSDHTPPTVPSKKEPIRAFEPAFADHTIPAYST